MSIKLMDPLDKIGKKDGPFEIYDENGRLVEKGTVKNGKRDGLLEAYYKSGKLRSRSTMKDGKLTGTSEKYYENGQLEQRTIFKDGGEQLFEYYDENGQLLTKGIFKDGKFISSLKDALKENEQKKEVDAKTISAMMGRGGH